MRMLNSVIINSECKKIYLPCLVINQPEMLEKKLYANGQPVYEMIGDNLTYFYKNGIIRATGPFINNLMEGEWIFYRETGQLWQIANFKNNNKHGVWIRYDRNDKIEYQEEFENNKVKNKK